MPIQIITAHTTGSPLRASHAAHPHKHPRVVPTPRTMNVHTDVPKETSVTKISCNAAHTRHLLATIMQYHRSIEKLASST